MTPELALKTHEDCVELKKFFESPAWGGIRDWFRKHRQEKREGMIAIDNDADLLSAQIGVLVCELPERIASEQLALDAATQDPRFHRSLNHNIKFASEAAVDKAIDQGHAAADAVGWPGYQIWARRMTALTWAHYLALTWCQPSERAVHQEWIHAIKSMFDDYQVTIDLGVVAEEFRERQVEEQVAKEKDNG